MNKKEMAKLAKEFEKGAAGAPVLSAKHTAMIRDALARKQLFEVDDVQEFEPYNDDDVYDPATQQPVEHIVTPGENRLHYPGAIDIGEITYNKKETEQ